MSDAVRKIRALLIDDEAYVRNFIGRLLKQNPAMEIVEARDGEDGLARFEAARPDIVFLDVNMPRLNGLRTLSALRKLSARVPIVMLTSIAEESVVEECVALGATFFIRKDMPPAELPAALRDVVNVYVGPDHPLP